MRTLNCEIRTWCFETLSRQESTTSIMHFQYLELSATRLCHLNLKPAFPTSIYPNGLSKRQLSYQALAGISLIKSFQRWCEPSECRKYPADNFCSLPENGTLQGGHIHIPPRRHLHIVWRQTVIRSKAISRESFRNSAVTCYWLGKALTIYIMNNACGSTAMLSAVPKD